MTSNSAVPSESSGAGGRAASVRDVTGSAMTPKAASDLLFQMIIYSTLRVARLPMHRKTFSS